MKKFLLHSTLYTLIFAFAACGDNRHVVYDDEVGNDTTIHVSRIDPANWFEGLKNPSLQLMVYGEGIGAADVTLGTYPGASIDSIVRMDSPNYLLVYLHLQDVKAGNMNINFRIGNRLRTIEYPIHERRRCPSEDIEGFSNADVLYMLMPDRFAKGADLPPEGMAAYTVDRSQPSLRHGGDLEGVRQHLNYFVDLGVTALWFTPVLENNSPDNGTQSTYHGYATTDYYRVDPRFGTNRDYECLSCEAHKKGLKVVMDMIFNHCGFDHPWVADMPMKDWFNRPEWLSEKADTEQTVNLNGQSAMATPPVNDKYLQTSYKLTPVFDPYASEVDRAETVDGWFVPSMPDLNQRNPHVITYLIQNSIWWIETAVIDGIRMDTDPYADREAMAKWMEALEYEYPNFNTVGETWVTEPAFTAAWQKGSSVATIDSHLKTVMDFSFYDKINQAAHEQTDAWWQGYNRIYNSLVYDYLYPNPDNVMAFIENHDTDRFLRNGQDIDGLRQALSLLLPMRRTPQLYYGTEVMMNGTKEVTDGNVRKDFPGGFPGDARNLFDPAQRTKEEAAAYDLHRRLLQWRKGNDVIVKGSQTQFCPVDGVYVLARRYEGRTVMTIVNGTSEAKTIALSRYAELLPATPVQARDILTDATVTLAADATLPIVARGTYVLEF